MRIIGFPIWHTKLFLTEPDPDSVIFTEIWPLSVNVLISNDTKLELVIVCKKKH